MNKLSNRTVKGSWEQKGISELCKTCKKKALKENTVSEQEVDAFIEALTDTVNSNN